ncbi:hypothetical protein FRC18_004297 [Serendipita sp. 400]|nr:hypothetical protein FRC18_004297 [Serendipita sp. 400]
MSSEEWSWGETSQHRRHLSRLAPCSSFKPHSNSPSYQQQSPTTTNSLLSISIVSSDLRWIRSQFGTLFLRSLRFGAKMIHLPQIDDSLPLPMMKGGFFFPWVSNAGGCAACAGKERIYAHGGRTQSTRGFT